VNRYKNLDMHCVVSAVAAASLVLGGGAGLGRQPVSAIATAPLALCDCAHRHQARCAPPLLLLRSDAARSIARASGSAAVVRRRHAALGSSASNGAMDPPLEDAVLTPPALSRFFTLRVATLLLALLGGFTAAFVRLERWSWVDAAYFVATTMSTIGFGDVRPAGATGMVLTCVLACCGVGVLGNLVSDTLAEWLRTPEVREVGTEEGEGGGDERRWDRVCRRRLARLGAWPRALIHFSLLMLVGVVGVRASEPAASRPSWASAAYLVTGALTTAGLGDVVPRSAAAKAFLSAYSLAGTLAFTRLVGRLALRPLEAERRAKQREVLGSYGERLTEGSLAALARGPVVKRLGLSQSDDFCSREEFMLLLLVQQGKVSEDDLDEVRRSRPLESTLLTY
jgi:hypothetical protein